LDFTSRAPEAADATSHHQMDLKPGEDIIALDSEGSAIVEEVVLGDEVSAR